MATLFTRAAFRDWIRRKLEIIPPIDRVPAGLVGAQPTDNPYPTNQQINDCLQDALNEINTYCGIHITQVSVSVNAQTANGPLAIYEGDLTYTGSSTPQVSPAGLITDVQRALWNDGTNGDVLLLPTSRDAQDRYQFTYYRNPPGTPQQYYTEGYVLNIIPAPSVSGTLTLTCGTGFIGLQNDSDTIDQLPLTYQSHVGFLAIVHLSRLMTEDAEAAQRAQNYLPLAQQGLQLIRAWKEGASGTNETFFLFTRSYRQNYGCRRVRR